jgi:cystathionine beta-lyase/cystathionine gamma-synthase
MQTKEEKRAEKKLDAEIDKLYRENCANIAIDIFDIPKVFAAAKKAKAGGRDMADAIRKFVESVRKN